MTFGHSFCEPLIRGILLRLPVVAQSELTAGTQSFRATELDLPESTLGILLMAGSILVLLVLTVRTSLRDSRFLTPVWRAALLLPRLLVLLLVLAIVLNPRERTQISRIEKSQVGVLVDTSVSMTYPAEDTGVAAPQGKAVSRMDAVTQALVEGGVLEELAKKHQLSLYTFDSALEGPVALVTDQGIRFPEGGDQDLQLSDAAVADQLRSVLQPSGSETRLGEAVHQLVGQMSGRTLSGLVLISDGRMNAGLSLETAQTRAARSSTRLISVGVGSERAQLNWWIAGMQSPADVHKGDPFEIQVSVQGSGAKGRRAVVRLYQQSPGGNGSDRRMVAEQPVQVTQDAIPVSVRFTQQLSIPGKFEYVARVEADGEESAEITLDDNERLRELEVTDRRIRVLVISSGPMRDYQFVRNTLYRHSGIESDVWLQTVADENVEFVSQEARHLLTRFPATEVALFEYDVIIAFDPDWSRLSRDERQYLNRWVAEHSGGLIVVAGEIFTPRMAQDPDGFRDISVLYPVVLNRMVPELQISQRADQPWPLTLTPEGAATEFLKIEDTDGNARIDLWSTFRGIYRSYPVRAVRDGAVTLLEYGNPRARTEIGQPPFLATQIYGTGRTVFLGSAETWRLREISPQGHQRFWTGLIRETGQGRRDRGSARGVLLLDRSESVPGQAINIRAQLYDSRLQPLQIESVALTILDPEGQPLNVPDRLNSDGRGTGQYLNNFRPVRPGVYRISVPVPESGDVLQETVEIVLPNLESQNPVQDVELLTRLTQDTEGRYVPVAEMAAVLPGLLPDRSAPTIVDEQLRTLWDRQWLMYLLIGLLALEWGLRRIQRLS